VLRAKAAGTGPSGVGDGDGDGSGVGVGTGSGVQEASSTPMTPAPAPISRVRRVILIVTQRYRARLNDAARRTRCAREFSSTSAGFGGLSTLSREPGLRPPIPHRRAGSLVLRPVRRSARVFPLRTAIPCEHAQPGGMI